MYSRGNRRKRTSFGAVSKLSRRALTFTKNALDLDLIRDELLSSIPAINKMLVRWSWPARLRNLIAQAGMQVRAGKDRADRRRDGAGDFGRG